MRTRVQKQATILGRTVVDPLGIIVGGWKPGWPLEGLGHIPFMNKVSHWQRLTHSGEQGVGPGVDGAHDGVGPQFSRFPGANPRDTSSFDEELFNGLALLDLHT